MSLKQINTYLSQENYIAALQLCKEHNQHSLGLLLSSIIPTNDSELIHLQSYFLSPKDNQKYITVKLLCNWLPSKELCELWNKMSQYSTYTWNNIKITWEEKADYYLIINSPYPNEYYNPSQTIIFHMEPNMSEHPDIWGEWSNPDRENFLRIEDHKTAHNNCEWHLSLNYSELSEMVIAKTNTFSAILSNKYTDPGHKKRIDFVKFLETKEDISIDIFGTNMGYKNYKGKLPLYKKDDGILPYKYHFACENNSIPNYFTEKLIDGILSGCLVFYWGCKNVGEYIDERAFIRLNLDDFEESYQTIKDAIENKEWEKRIKYIMDERKKILNELQFFPRLEKIITEING